MNRTTSTRAITFTAPQQVEVRKYDLPECGPSDIVLHTLYSMVSTGTELRTLIGKQQIVGDEPYYPCIPGYSHVSEVIEVGADAKGWRVGDLVSGRGPCRALPGARSTWGGQAEYHVASSGGGGQPILLPADSNPLDYVPVELAAIAYKGFRAAGMHAGETVIVIGQGMIGALSAAWFAQAGARTAVVDLAEGRLRRARNWGVAGTFPASDPAVRERLIAFAGGGADIVVEASSSMAGVRLAASLLRDQRAVGDGLSIRWPRLLFQATYTDEYSSRPERLFGPEGALVLTPGDRSVDDRIAAVEAFRTGRLRAADFVDKILPVSEVQIAYDGLRTKQDEFFSVVFDWSK